MAKKKDINWFFIGLIFAIIAGIVYSSYAIYNNIETPYTNYLNDKVEMEYLTGTVFTEISDGVFSVSDLSGDSYLTDSRCLADEYINPVIEEKEGSIIRPITLNDIGKSYTFVQAKYDIGSDGCLYIIEND